MCSQAEPGKIIVDARVQAIASSILLFEDMGTVQAKGYADPVPIFSFVQTLLTPKNGLIKLLNETPNNTAYRENSPIGRKATLSTLRLGLHDFMEGVSGCQHQFHFLEGDEGIGKSEIVKELCLFAKSKGVTVVAALGLESYSNRNFWLMAQLIDKIMLSYEETPPPPTMQHSSSSRRLSIQSSPVATVGFTIVGEREGGVDSGERCDGPRSETGSSETPWTYSKRFKHWAEEHLSYNIDPRGVRQRAMVHGYPVMDIVDLIGEVFHEVIPHPNPALETINKKQKQLLLKTFLVRTLKVAFQGRHRILLVENLCRSDIGSATVINDFIGSAESAFGVMTYRGDALKHEIFRGIRVNSYSTVLPPLKQRHSAELVAAILGPLYRAVLSKEMLTRIYLRTNGNPSLIEALTLALLPEIEKGTIPSIEDVRTPGQQSIVQKFDRLDAPLQLLLKTAAAVGQVFSLNALIDVYKSLAKKESRLGNLEEAMLSGRDVTLSGRGDLMPEGGELDHLEMRLQSPSVTMIGTDHLQLHLDELVDQGLLVATAFKQMTRAVSLPCHRLSVHQSWQEATPRITSLMIPLNLKDGFEDEDVDTPEIDALPWIDARGNKRRGWFMIEDNNKKQTDVDGSSKTPPIPICATPTRDRSHHTTISSPSILVPRKTNNQYFRFAHPSIQSTVYSLSLDLDRMPVHEAIISHLMRNFPDCPGVEETCLQHARKLKNNQVSLKWLMQCALSTKETNRYAFFIQHATHLLSMLVKSENGMEAELDLQVFQLVASFNATRTHHNSPPRLYCYEMGQRELPTWRSVSGDDDDWLYTVGGIMRDMMMAMVRLGSVQLLEQLGKTSQVLLDGIITRKTEDDEEETRHHESLKLNVSEKRRMSRTIVESVVEAYHLQPVDDIDLEMARPTFVRASFVHSFVRGQEALAVMHILRGNGRAALDILQDAIDVVRGAGTDGCSVLQAICFPRLFALRSCCYSIFDGRTMANRSLIQAELWLSKAKETDIDQAIAQYYGRARPVLGGLRECHADDTGEWVLMVVVAMRLCGEGKWEGAIEELESALLDLKEINDKTSAFQVRLLYAWALFMTGDIQGFHTRMRSIKQYTDQVDEPLTDDAAGELLSFRFSLSCFCDASEILVAKFKTANPDSNSQSSSVPVSQRTSFNQTQGQLSFKGLFGGTGLNIYHRITEAFQISRSQPQNLDMLDMIEICQKISRRSPCHYIGGMYLFFSGLAAIACYEHYLAISSQGLLPTKATDLVPFVKLVESEIVALGELHVAIQQVVASLEILARKDQQPIMLYLFRALKIHECRICGEIDEAMKFAVLENKCPSESVPLAVAFLKMEIALCRQMADDDRLSLADKRDNLSTAILVAKESRAIFSIFEADIEIATLKRCITDCEDLLRQLMPAYNGGKGGSSMTARAYWLDLNCDEDSDNEK